MTGFANGTQHYIVLLDSQLAAVWAGLLALNVLRSVSIWVPYRLRWKPFDGLGPPAAAAAPAEPRG
jgi:hypothetical protein